MLNKFFGKSDKPAASPTQAGGAQPGADLHAIEPDTALGALGSAPASPRPEAASRTEAQPDFEQSTMQIPLEPLGPEERKSQALQTVEQQHQRIANTIRTLWGYKECGVYINRLIMSGGDGQGPAHVGFNQEAMQAMMELSDLHDAAFGAPDAGSGGLGLSL